MSFPPKRVFSLDGPKIFTGFDILEDHSVVITDGIIDGVVPSDQIGSGIQKVDLGGGLLAPGFLDLQVNGGGGAFFNTSPDLNSLDIISKTHRCHGTTGLLPTLISDSSEALSAAATAVRTAINNKMPGIVGVHFEGPYINLHRRGIHAKEYIAPKNFDAIELLATLEVGTTLLTVAPECVPKGLIRRLTGCGVHIAIGHSNATYEEASIALAEGARGFTHLFNAMTPLKSRQPGCVGAALDDDTSWFGIIADGYHVHPATLRIALAAKSPGKVILISDAMPATKSNMSTFDWNGETIYVEKGRCTTADGTLAGSTLTLRDAIVYVIENLNIGLEEALRMASAYPAEAIGRQDEFGYVRPGNHANLVLLDERLDVIETWVDGNRFQS
jgi:N-acetylglucosamine-6-phosphate deacetylase